MVALGGAFGLPAYLSRRGRLGIGLGGGGADRPSERRGNGLVATGAGEVEASYGTFGYRTEWVSFSQPGLIVSSCQSEFHQFSTTLRYEILGHGTANLWLAFGPQITLIDLPPIRPGVQLGAFHRWHPTQSLGLTTRLFYLPTYMRLASSTPFLVNHSVRGGVRLAAWRRHSVHPFVELEVGANRNGPFRWNGEHYDKVQWNLEPYAVLRIGLETIWGG